MDFKGSFLFWVVFISEPIYRKVVVIRPFRTESYSRYSSGSTTWYQVWCNSIQQMTAREWSSPQDEVVITKWPFSGSWMHFYRAIVPAIHYTVSLLNKTEILVRGLSSTKARLEPLGLQRKSANRWSCSAIGCTNRDTKETKDKTYKVLSNTGENRREDYV